MEETDLLVGSLRKYGEYVVDISASQKLKGVEGLS